MTSSKIPVQQNSPSNDDQFPVLRGRQVRRDKEGRICLNDIWEVAGRPTEQRPSDWRQTPGTARLVQAALRLITGKSGSWTKEEVAAAYAAKPGRYGGSYADVRLALAYAKYLDPDLAMEVNEVFLRYVSGDAWLADEILERSTADENRRIAVRAMGRVTRGQFTDVLQDHGVKKPFFGICTNVVYQTVLGGPADALKRALAVPANGSLRDALSTTQLAAVALAESFSADRIQYDDCRGGPACKQATASASRNVRAAVDAEERSRRQSVAEPANDSDKADDAA